MLLYYRLLHFRLENFNNYARLYDVIHQIEGIAFIHALFKFTKRLSGRHCAG